MENLSDLELVKNIKEQTNVEDCLQELINRHSGIYLEMVNSFLKNCDNNSLRDEIVSEKAYAIYNTALKYDENRGTKFSTFLGNEAKWICLNASNKNRKFVAMNDQTFDFEKNKSRNKYRTIQARRRNS